MASEDDLERTLMLAAADADARNTETERESVIKKIDDGVKEPKQKIEPEAQNRRGLKRRVDDDDDDNNSKKLEGGYASVVASHYNTLEEKGLDERSNSRIFYMRNFHNWIKSMLINDNLNKIKKTKKYNAPLRVLDMCCGKGGDLLKWRKGGISHLICSDIASVSLDQCKSRYESMTQPRRQRNPGNLYSIEFIPADCSKVRLREKYKDPSMKLDLVSCQFAFHYSFESLPQAECMLRNAGECLDAGGFFVGTIPDANELISRVRKSPAHTFGNDVFQVSFDFDVEKPPLFGGKYNFNLEGVVDCPEFLVHFPTLVELAKKYGLKLVQKEKFHDVYERFKSDGQGLLDTMKSLEPYPPFEDATLVGTSDGDYKHAEQYWEQTKRRPDSRMGTLSRSEWEASSLYLAFVFVKVKNTWNADGTPKYDI